MSDPARRDPSAPTVPAGGMPRRDGDGGPTTIHQVAALAGVSIATVSRVLGGSGRVSPALRERVESAAASLHYQPNRAARNLRARRGTTIGVLIPDIQNLFFTAMVRGMDDELSRRGYTVLLGNSDGDPARERIYVDTFRAEQVAGLLVVPSQREDALYRDLAAAGVPIVALDRGVEAPTIDHVSVTNLEGAAEGVRHLVELGHRRIGMVAGLVDLNIGMERIEGYRRALADAGIPWDASLVIDGHFNLDAARDATFALLDLPDPPTAVFSANNSMTLGVMQALHLRGLSIPGDVSVVGFDDMPWQMALDPPVTCVAQPTYELGATAAELLLDRIARQELPTRRVVLDTTLIVRGSTAPPRSA